MKKIIKTIFLGLFFSFYSFDAQQVVKTDTLSGTPLIISMDKRIKTEMDNMEANCDRAINKSSGSFSSDSDTPKRIIVPSRELTTAEICRRNPRIMGIKIQIAVVKSNEEANKIKAYFRSKYPNIKVQTDASLRPNYKILAGSYFSKQSAGGDLSKIRQHFQSAIPVKYSIFCAEAK